MLTPYSIARDMFDEVFDSAFSGYNARGMMSTDIKETDQGYELEIDMPGVEKENISAELNDGYLIVSAKIGHSTDDDKKEKYLRRERFNGSFRRSFYVGSELKQEDIHARFENGILHLFLPKFNKNAQIETKNTIAIE